jgi:predicted transcriptional regulator
MKLNRTLAALVLTFVLVLSFAALLQQQKDTLAFSANLLTFPVAFNVGSAFSEKPAFSENFTRTMVLNFVKDNPGVQFRGICSGLGLSVGVVQFHLAVLQKTGLVSFIRKGRYKRFFAAGKFSRKEMGTIAELRLSTVKNILKALLEGKRVSHHDLAVQVSISSQGLTWQMNRLRETGLIQETRTGLSVTYMLEQTSVPTITEALTLLKSS